MKLISYMQEKREIINLYLKNNLPSEKTEPVEIHQSIRYSVLNGGKRLRPILTMMTAELLGFSHEKVLPAAAGIELIHTFSLIHDDLPCMDNDDYRRGKLTNHKVYGEALATLAGDALLIMGINFICNNSKVKGISKESVLDALQYVLSKIGTEKMLGGQVDDINLQKKQANQEKIKKIYSNKTSALICASLNTASLLLNAKKDQFNALEKYGENIGMAFQITDDLLDIQQDNREENKSTYIKLFGIQESKKEALDYCERAKDNILLFGDKSALFIELADYIINRTY